jgi:hypothetical protein
LIIHNHRLRRFTQIKIREKNKSSADYADYRRLKKEKIVKIKSAIIGVILHKYGG